MRRRGNKAGVTLVEVLIAVVLVAATAAIIYEGVFYSYKTVMRSRARLEAQEIAFDKIWELCNLKTGDLNNLQTKGVQTTSTPPNCIFSTGGFLQWSAPYNISNNCWEITVQVWAPSNSPLFSVMATNGTVTSAYMKPIAEYKVLRYPGDNAQ